MPLSEIVPSPRASVRPGLLNSYELRLMVRELTQHQACTSEQVLADTGVSLRQLENPAHGLTLEQELMLYTRVARLNSDPLLGIRIGARLSLTNYGMLGHAMMGAVTVLEALQLLTEFAPLVSWASHSQLASETHQGQPCKALSFFPTAVDPCAGALEVESTFASLQTVFNDLMGEPVHFAALEMAHSAPDCDLAPYREIFSCPLRFSCKRNALLIPAPLLARRLPHPQPEYSQLFRDMCRQSMLALTEDRGLIASIKSMLRVGEGAVPTLDEIAGHFKQSARTLRRHLHAQGVSYQGLLDELRYDQARRYLSSTQLPVQQIAQHLGYAEARSFRTAFKRWSGRTPVEFRRESPAD